MTRRRNSINIYDYPEHLNPFRDDVDDESDRFNTTGRRSSSFRAMFTGHKGKSKTSEDVSPHNHTATSRFMTWTPKLLRRSFRRSSPSRTTSPAPSSSQLVFRSASSRTSLPPAGSSHNSLHSSRSRSMLPPTSSPPPKPTSPPERPAPPNILLTQSADTTPVPPRRRALYTASSPVKPAGEMPTEDEVKYLQQGAKPKKKRRAPLPPGPPPSKSPEDNQQVISNQEPEASLTSSITSSSVEEPAQVSTAEEPTPPEQSVSISTTVEQHQNEPEKEISESKLLGNDEKGNSQPTTPKESSQEAENKPEKDTPELEENVPHSEISTNNADVETREKSENETVADKNVTDIQNDENRMEEKQVNGIANHKNSFENLKMDFNVVLHISEEDLRDKEPPAENGSLSENDINHNIGHPQANGVLKTGASVKSAGENEIKLHNGENGMDESELSDNEMNAVNISQSPLKPPEPKPRTILSTK